MENVQTPKNLKQRKLLLVLPLLVIPFLTMAFWALGGGKASANNVNTANTPKGLNLNLPSANIKEDKNADKMSFYEKAKLDEEKSVEAMKNDPFFNLSGNFSDSNQLESVVFNSPTRYKPGSGNIGLNTSPIHSENYSDPNEARIMDKLNLLQKEINQPQTNISKADNNLYQSGSNETITDDIDRLQDMAAMMKDKQDDDPEMGRLEGMLDKIMDIQHPERVKDRIKEKSTQQKQKVFPVTRLPFNQSISLLGKTDTARTENSNGFFGAQTELEGVEQNAIEAVVHESQTLVNGSVVKFRLLNDIFINGTLIPGGQFVFGIANLNGERLTIEINTVRNGQSLFPVKLNVYDLDGLEGIYIPGAISRDVAKQSVDNGLQSMELATINPSISAQAAATGINAAKSLLSKKAKLVKVTVKAGYKVLLKDKNNEQ
jgi:conjugative transposon TraM protein